MAGTESEPRPLPTLQRGTRFGQYEIVRKIGEGGMGEVYEALRPDLGRRVALKVMHSPDSATAQQRFTREARIAATLDHPHVATCIDFGTEDGAMFLALEFLEGETLAARLARGPMPVAEVVETLLPIASAIIAAHELSEPVVHRDLKPENIMLARKFGVMVPKLLDFGIAKHLSMGIAKGPTASATILGTPRYMAPEQVRDASRAGPSADQFSFGVILWEALAGQTLFQGTDVIDVLYRVATIPSPSVRTVAPEVPEGLAEVIARMLAKTPAERFGSMRAAANELLPYASSVSAEHWRPILRAAPVSDAHATAPFVHETTLPADQLVNALTPSRSSKPPPPAAPPRGIPLLALGGGAVALVLVAGWFLLPHRRSAPKVTSSPPAALVALVAATGLPVRAPLRPIPRAGGGPPDASPLQHDVGPPVARPSAERSHQTPRCGRGRRCPRDGGLEHTEATPSVTAPPPAPPPSGVDELPPIR